MNKILKFIAASALALSLAACSSGKSSSANGVSGTFTGTGTGRGGDITVTLTLEDSVITNVEIVGEGETEGLGDVAMEKMAQDMLAYNSVEVDTVATATVTSNGVLEAALNALKEAGLTAADLVRKEDTGTVEDKTYDADVVIIGAGGAGMTAAITAAQNGSTVIILESQAVPGGNSVRSTGGMNAAETKYQDTNEFENDAAVEKTLASAESYTGTGEETIKDLAATVRAQYDAYKANPEGYFDSVELFELDTLIGGKGINDVSLVETLALKSADAIDWLSSIGADLNNVGQFGGASVKRIHRPVDENGKTLSVGSYLVPILKSTVETLGIEVLYETTAEHIIMEDGAAVGVTATTSKGAAVTVNAKSVVIAAGGFGANNEMVASLNSALDGYVTTNASGILGQGIVMAEEVGAATVDMDQIQLHPTVHVAEDGSANLITEGLRGDGAILVNQEGVRFYDEVSTRDKVSNAENSQTGGYAWLIIDSKMYDASNVIQGYVTKGFAKTGATVEELASEIGVDAETLKNTLDTWNTYVEKKEDPDFGRTTFAEALDTAPYYAIKVQPGVHHTMGGVAIDSATEVLDTNGDVIPGLFAAGEVTGGVHGANRLGGNAVADFVVFGNVAGNEASEYAK